MAVDECYFCYEFLSPGSGRRLISEESSSGAVIHIREYLIRCRLSLLDRFWLCKRCFSKAERGFKSLSISDAIVGEFKKNINAKVVHCGIQEYSDTKSVSTQTIFIDISGSSAGGMPDHKSNYLSQVIFVKHFECISHPIIILDSISISPAIGLVSQS